MQKFSEIIPQATTVCLAPVCFQENQAFCHFLSVIAAYHVCGSLHDILRYRYAESCGCIGIHVYLKILEIERPDFSRILAAEDSLDDFACQASRLVVIESAGKKHIRSE